MEKSIWKKEVRKNTSVKGLGLCYRIKRGICTEKRKSLLIIKRGKRRDTSICGGLIKKKVYLIFQAIPNVTSIFCGKKGWHTKNGIRLLVYKSVDNKGWVSLIPHCRHTR